MRPRGVVGSSYGGGSHSSFTLVRNVWNAAFRSSEIVFPCARIVAHAIFTSPIDSSGFHACGSDDRCVLVKSQRFPGFVDDSPMKGFAQTKNEPDSFQNFRS